MCLAPGLRSTETMRGAEASLQALIQSSVQPPGYLPDQLTLSSYLSLPPSSSGHETQTPPDLDVPSTLLQQAAGHDSAMVYEQQHPQGLELRGMGSVATPSDGSLMTSSASAAFSPAMTSFSPLSTANVDGGMTSVSAGFSQTMTSFSHPPTDHVDGMTSLASGPLPGMTAFSYPQATTSVDAATSLSTGALPGIASFSSQPSGQYHTLTSSPQHASFASTPTPNTGSASVGCRPKRNVPNVINIHSPHVVSTPCRDPTTDELEKARHRQFKAAMRKERNKEAARQSNLKKKMERERLEKQSLELWEENLQLHQDIQNLSQKLRHFKHMRNVMQHVCHHSPGPMTACY